MIALWPLVFMCGYYIYTYLCVCAMCLFVCMWVLNCSGEYHVCLTVWYICTPVACDSRYTLSTIRRLNDRHPNFACIFLHFKNVLTFLLCLSTALLHSAWWWIYWNGPFHKLWLHCDLLYSCAAIVTCLVRFISKTSNANRGHYKKECTPLLKHAVSEIMLTTNVH